MNLEFYYLFIGCLWRSSWEEGSTQNSSLTITFEFGGRVHRDSRRRVSGSCLFPSIIVVSKLWRNLCMVEISRLHRSWRTNRNARRSLENLLPKFGGVIWSGIGEASKGLTRRSALYIGWVRPFKVSARVLRYHVRWLLSGAFTHIHT